MTSVAATGWIRRPERDPPRSRTWVWQAPDGTLRAFRAFYVPSPPQLRPHNTIVAQLRALREAQSLPLKTVAHDLGVTLEWLCKLEHGTDRSAAAELLERWADSLGAVVVIATKPGHRKRRAA
jgi:hypothetical protein